MNAPAITPEQYAVMRLIVLQSHENWAGWADEHHRTLAALEERGLAWRDGYAPWALTERGQERLLALLAADQQERDWLKSVLTGNGTPP